MSEIVDSLLEKYKNLLKDEESISPELIEALGAELSRETPNAERLVELIKKPRKTES